ncbi:MAG: glycoside hydrolase family 140 protein [Candidatus Hinthialibacter antarcticus]|nr:glycoside hydrolase family 140 protein [Candidatus Hinthialibacter antarcticus]
MRSLITCILGLACISTFAQEAQWQGPSVDFSHGALHVSENQRFLVHQDGTPFFYLGDTAWELFHRLNREEAEQYLENRRQKGMNVIQAVGLAELDGLNTPNAYGEKPLIDNDPTKPNEKYFEHVDFIVNTAKEKGLYIGFLPTWGDKATKAWGQGPVILTNDNTEDARAYGRFLGERYKDAPNIIWILIGDRDAEGYEAIWRAMAKGIGEGDRGAHLITCHPMGGMSSSKWFHDDNWLDFNMLQSGHGSFDNTNYKMIDADYNRKPTKPTLDGEPRYENHPVNWKPENGWFNDFDVRQAAYWGVFAGGLGTTYGCHDIWQMVAPGHTPISSARGSWDGSLDLPGVFDMIHLRKLMESRPFFDRVPDPSLIAEGQFDDGRHLQATRGKDYAFVYVPYGTNFKLNMGKISGDKSNAWWFNPRDGKAGELFEVKNEGVYEFDPPGEPKRGNDWVLVLDDASKGYKPL